MQIDKIKNQIFELIASVRTNGAYPAESFIPELLHQLETEVRESVVEYYPTFQDVQNKVAECEGKHIQQVAYSSYHKALTQTCLTCKKIRTSLSQPKEDNHANK
jgi:hypothetical protein